MRGRALRRDWSDWHAVPWLDGLLLDQYIPDGDSGAVWEPGAHALAAEPAIVEDRFFADGRVVASHGKKKRRRAFGFVRHSK